MGKYQAYIDLPKYIWTSERILGEYTTVFTREYIKQN